MDFQSCRPFIDCSAAPQRAGEVDFTSLMSGFLRFPAADRMRRAGLSWERHHPHAPQRPGLADGFQLFSTSGVLPRRPRAAAIARALAPVQRHDTPACRDGQGAAVTAWAVPLRGAIPQICYRRCPGSGRVESASPP